MPEQFQHQLLQRVPKIPNELIIHSRRLIRLHRSVELSDYWEEVDPIKAKAPMK